MKIFIILFYYIKQKLLIQYLKLVSLEKYQKRKLLRHLKFVKKNSPFYQTYLKKVDFEEFQKIPIITKNEFMENFNTINTLGLDREEAFAIALDSEKSREFSSDLKGVTVGLSSGTSGHRGIFLASKFETLKYAGTVLAKALPGSILSKWKIAFFLRANSNLYTSVKSSRITFEYFDLFQSERKHLERLAQLQPDILIAPASVLKRLAAFQQQKLIYINPQKIISVAEVLEPLDRSLIEKIFQQKVHQIYQATEGFLGLTCSLGNLHLNEDHLFIEKEFINQEKTKFYPIITDMSRRTQPVIRYKLNDVLTLADEDCPCGFPFTTLKYIDGRSDDILYFSDSFGKDVPIYPDFMRRAVISTSHYIEDYHVCFTQDKELIFKLKCPQETFENSKEEITNYLEKIACENDFKIPNIRFENGTIERKRDQKQRRVENQRPQFL